MGGICSSNDNVSKDEKNRNAAINKDMRIAATQDKSVVKTLLLGTGESGKSTVFKQMIKLNGGGLTQEKMNSFHDGVRRNALESILTLIKQSRIFTEQKRDDCALSDDIAESVAYVMQFEEFVDEGLVPETGPHLERVWADSGAKETLKYRVDFEHHIIDNAVYFLDKVGDIYKDDYQLTEEDAFRVRVMTTGMTQKIFELNGRVKMMLVDVGGQRSERRKWIQWFEGVGAVLFVVAVSEYNMVLFEDGKTNRFDESLETWKDVIENPVFSDTRFMLFLNKSDLFRDQIEEYPIRDYIQDYSGDTGYDAGMEYFANRYLDTAGEKANDVQVHYTTATDSDIMVNVFDTIKLVLIQQVMGDAGMI